MGRYSAIAGTRIEVVVLPKAGIDEVLELAGRQRFLTKFASEYFLKAYDSARLQLETFYHPSSSYSLSLFGRGCQKDLIGKWRPEVLKCNPALLERFDAFRPTATLRVLTYAERYQRSCGYEDS